MVNILKKVANYNPLMRFFATFSRINFSKTGKNRLLIFNQCPITDLFYVIKVRQDKRILSSVESVKPYEYMR
jgi:hypothetical protein